MEVAYVDLLQPEAESQHAELLALAEERELPYPLVAINGRLRLAGSAELFQVVALVDEELHLAGAVMEV